MDKKEYKGILEAVNTHTGTEVEFLGDAKDKAKKEINKTKTTPKSSAPFWWSLIKASCCTVIVHVKRREIPICAMPRWCSF
jgi:hypothetical protein